jgi:hypothetical protein
MNARNTSLLVFLSMGLTAQVVRDVAPLKQWPAPLYWQPSDAGTPSAGAQPDAAATSPQAQSPVSSLVFVATTPCRVIDTRSGQGFSNGFGPPSLVGLAMARTFRIQSSTTCTIPSVAQAYSFNVTVVPPGFLGFITVFPTGAAQPNASTINDSTGLVLANAAVVAAGTGGSVDVYANNDTDLIVDINGYYAPQTGITLAQGTAAAPSLSFAGDPGTGIFSSAAGVVNIATHGTNLMTIGDKGNVGVGVSSPNSRLDVGGDVRTSGGIIFPDNTKQVTATVTGPAGATGPAGPQGPTGPQGPPGPNVLVQGSAAAPSLPFANDAGTGLLSDASKTVSIATAGVSRFTVRPDGDVEIPNSIRKNGLLFLHDNPGLSSQNTALGLNALHVVTSGFHNTALGDNALSSNTTASGNTAIGAESLFSSTGAGNTGVGDSALTSNLTGSSNTAVGASALINNTSGNQNVAIGDSALSNNTTGMQNVALGSSALSTTTTATLNTAIGYLALQNSTGNGNLALGALAGQSITTGLNNIMIANNGQSTDDKTIRIGGLQLRAFIAGIRGVTVTNPVAVMIDANGQLGTVNSSRRFKEDIRDMGEVSTSLLRLRPVTYRYRQPYTDGSKPLDYGLIAEEVAEIYPDLVAKSSDGQIETVQYQKLTPMLLNELQKQNETIRMLQEKGRLLETRLAAVEAILSAKTQVADGQ